VLRAGKRRDQRRLAAGVVTDARVRFEEAEQAAAVVIERNAPVRDRYISLLRGLASGGPGGVGVHIITVEVVDGMLPEGVEVLELTSAARSGAEVDAVAVIETGGFYAPGQPGSRPRIGDVAETLALLPVLLASSRSLGIGRRYRGKIASLVGELDRLIEGKETDFAGRLSALESMRVGDATGFTEIQLARVRPQIIASVSTVLEHASVHLASELEQVTASWVDSLANASSAAELGAAVSAIDAAWETTMKRVAEEVRLLAMGGVGGIARYLHVPLVSPLVPMGLPEADARPPKAAPALEPVAILPALTNASAAKLDDTGWFAGLFRSFETRRTEVRTKAIERLGRLTEVASAELMDAEPKFHAAVREALVGQLAGAIATQTRYVEQALVKERERIAAEKAELAPVIAVRDRARAELAALDAEIERIETEQPALAITTTAAETASLSA